MNQGSRCGLENGTEHLNTTSQVDEYEVIKSSVKVQVLVVINE